jgi:thiamine-monophosphate kinase
VTGARSIGEFGRIAQFFRPLAAGFPGALGLADDAAIIEVLRGEELVVTTDAIVAGVHFLPSDPPEDVARKALRVNLSDLAAKGARPLAYTLALALSPDITDDWVARFAAGLADDQAGYGIALAGGDSVSTPGPIWASITAMGLVARGRMVRRSGAKPGDAVFVTGTIGDAALGLAAATGVLDISDDDRAALVARYRLPLPRSALAPALCRWAHAAIDVSDGLAADFAHLCRASCVDGTIKAGLVPLSGAARRVLAGDSNRLRDILGGGDDYEILFTAPTESARPLAEAAAAAGVALTEIGTIEAGPGRAVLTGTDGCPLILARPGWSHS